MARVVRPELREYSVSPTPTMQYLSRSPRLWTIISRVPPRFIAAPRPAGSQPRDGLRCTLRRSWELRLSGHDPAAARCYHFAADRVTAPVAIPQPGSSRRVGSERRQAAPILE